MAMTDVEFVDGSCQLSVDPKSNWLA